MSEEEFNEEPGDENDDLFSAAYDDVVYRDSTGDDVDANMLEIPGSSDHVNDEWEQQIRRLSPRLAFLAMVAEQWKMVVAAFSSRRLGQERGRGTEVTKPRIGSDLPAAAVPDEWRIQAKMNRQKLAELAAAIQRKPIAPSSIGFEALVEYDRRRLTREMLLEKIVATLSSTLQAELMLTAVDRSAMARAAAAPAEPETKTAAPGEEKTVAAIEEEAAAGPQTVAIVSMVMTGDAEGVRGAWGAFLAEIVHRPLLYVPLARGGDARKLQPLGRRNKCFGNCCGICHGWDCCARRASCCAWRGQWKSSIRRGRGR